MPSSGRDVDEPRPIPSRRLDSSPILPRTLVAFAWRISGGHQLGLAILSVLVFLLSAAPLELQRRIVNSAVHEGAAATILWLAAAYGAVALAEGCLKLAMNVYRGWISESAVRHLRRLILHLPTLPAGGQQAAEIEGMELSMVLSEVEPVGGFVGVSTSEPLLQGGILVSIFGYMAYLEPEIALVSLLVLSPQAVFVPLLQGAINRRVQTRIRILRSVSRDLIDRNHRDPGAGGDLDERIDRVLILNLGIFKLKFTMNFLMNLMHHLGVASVLAVGGWYAATGRIEIGTVVAFISGLAKVNDPWGDIVNWFRDATVNSMKYRLIADAVERLRAGPRG